MLIHKRALELHRAAANDPSRVALNGVRILDKGGAVATNGHIMIEYRPAEFHYRMDLEYPVIDGMRVAYLEGEKEVFLKPFTLPADACRDLLRALPRERRALPVISNYVAIDTAATNDNGTALIGINSLDEQRTFKPRKVDADYPDYTKVIPRQAPKAWAGFSIDYVEKICAVFKACGAKVIKVGIREETTPATFKAETEDGDLLTATIMPIRTR